MNYYKLKFLVKSKKLLWQNVQKQKKNHKILKKTIYT